MITSSPAAFSQNAFPFSTDDSFWAPPPHQPSVSNDALSLNFPPNNVEIFAAFYVWKVGIWCWRWSEERCRSPLLRASSLHPSSSSPACRSTLHIIYIFIYLLLYINFIHIALVFVLVCYRPISRPLFRIFRFLCISLNFSAFFILGQL